jgi:hypothetical protein
MKKKQLIIDLDTIRDMSKRFNIYLEQDYPLISKKLNESNLDVNSFNFMKLYNIEVSKLKKDKSLDKKLKEELKDFNFSEFVETYVLQIYGHSYNTDINNFMLDIIDFRMKNSKYEFTILVRNYLYDITTINTKGASASLHFISLNFNTFNNIRVIYTEKNFKKEVKSLKKDTYLITSDKDLIGLSDNIKIIDETNSLSKILTEIK